MAIVSAVIVVAGLGALFGYLLSWAEKKLAIQKNEKEVQLEAVMPGANCGGCGFAGCNAYADAVARGEAEIGLCIPGGAATAAKMAEIMGTNAPVEGDNRRKVAHVFCKGTATSPARNTCTRDWMTATAQLFCLAVTTNVRVDASIWVPASRCVPLGPSPKTRKDTSWWMRPNAFPARSV